MSGLYDYFSPNYNKSGLINTVTFTQLYPKLIRKYNFGLLTKHHTAVRLSEPINEKFYSVQTSKVCGLLRSILAIVIIAY